MPACPRCDGCGKLANDDEGTPWSRWLDLPLKSSIAVQMGLVRPVVCPVCGGTGQAQQSESAEEA